MTYSRSITDKYMNEPPISIQNSFDESKIIKRDMWGGGFILHNALSEEECNYLIEESEKIGWGESLHWKRGENDFRINERIMVASEELANFMWKRVEKYMLENSDNGKDITTTVLPNSGLYKIGSPTGVWKPIGLNSKIRICKYFKGGLFKKHYDGSYVVNDSKRSLYTFMFYLNDTYTGGATNFLDDQSLKEISSVLHLKDVNTGTADDIEVNTDQVDLESLKIVDVVGPLKTGNLVVFPQDLFHEGSPVIDGVKYICRTDVMFEKVSELDPSQLKSSEPLNLDLEAERYLLLAEELERSGSVEESVKMYKKAFSMSKSLASKYGF